VTGKNPISATPSLSAPVERRPKSEGEKTMTTATKTLNTKTESPKWLEEHTPAVRGVYAALTAHPGSTAAELADLASVGRSTATKALTTLETAGHAKRTSTARTATGRRTPDHWQTTVTKTAKAKRTPKTPAMERVASTRTSTTRRATAPEPAPVSAVRASKRAAAPTEATPPVAAPTRPPVALPEGKLRNGELTQLVMDQLNAAPAQEWTVRDLWKILDRSQGAISNALERATIKGTAIRTGEAPRRYRLTAAPAAAPAEPADGELVTVGAPSPRRGRPRRASS
jgi:predicted transcriptional regulator